VAQQRVVDLVNRRLWYSKGVGEGTKKSTEWRCLQADTNNDTAAAALSDPQHTAPDSTAAVAPPRAHNVTQDNPHAPVVLPRRARGTQSAVLLP
jgi:hypothetical protein